MDTWIRFHFMFCRSHARILLQFKLLSNMMKINNKKPLHYTYKTRFKELQQYRVVRPFLPHLYIKYVISWTISSTFGYLYYICLYAIDGILYCHRHHDQAKEHDNDDVENDVHDRLVRANLFRLLFAYRRWSQLLNLTRV